ncbi:MAG: hypothetical protein KGM44_10765 [bacterium]|nr:hypothetical protein [bacterium]
MTLRVLAVVDGPEARPWDARCLETLRTCPNVHLTVVAIPNGPRRLTVAERLATVLWHRGMLARAPLAGTPSIAEIGDEGLPAADLIVDLRDVPRARRPVTAHHGTVYRSADARGGLPFFGQILSGSPTVEAELRLIDRTGITRTLRWGRFLFNYSYDKTLRMAADTYCVWLRTFIEGLGHEDASRYRGATQSESPNERVGLGEVLRFSWLCALHLLQFAGRLFFVDTSWDIGISRAEPADVVESGRLGDVRWLHPQERRPFYADPFYLRSGDREYVLCEGMPRGSRTGVIEELELTPDARVASTRVVLSNGSHLSYPFIFEHDGATYAVPESNAAGRVDAYAIAADGTWRYHKTLLEDLDACDSTIFRHDGKWWLFCTQRSTGSNLHLYAYVSNDPLGLWRPHRANPIKTDVRSARPAGGIFEHNGALYRPAQDCGDSYGGALVVHRIVSLDESTYEEVPVRTLRPLAPYMRGLHTLTLGPGIVIIDGRRDHISLSLALWQCWRLLWRLLGRVRRSETASHGPQRCRRSPSAAGDAGH